MPSEEIPDNPPEESPGDTSPPEEAEAPALECFICKKAIDPDDLAGDTPAAILCKSFDPVNLEVVESGDGMGYHVACSEAQLPIDMSKYMPGHLLEGALARGEAWEQEWQDVLQYVYQVRERVRAGAAPSGDPALYPASATLQPLDLTPAPTRPLHIGHPTIEAWLHLFELEVVDQVADVLAPRPQPSEDEMLFGSMGASLAPPMALPGVEIITGEDEEVSSGPAERCEALLAITEASISQLKRYCRTAKRSRPSHLVARVIELVESVAALKLQAGQGQAGERTFSPTF